MADAALLHGWIGKTWATGAKETLDPTKYRLGNKGCLYYRPLPYFKEACLANDGLLMW